VHYVGIVFTGKDVSGPAHIGCKLINFVETAIDHMSYEVRITKVADYEIISLRFTETRELEIGSSDPKPLPFEPPNKVMTDEAAGPANEGNFSRH
jgi:hypothetical protein